MLYSFSPAMSFRTTTLAAACVSALIAFPMWAQTASTSEPIAAYSHGTCATTALAPFGAAFIVDSRITMTDATGKIISQGEGCKVVLARPTILLVGVGLEDTTNILGRWNTLDQASAALGSLKGSPTEEDLNQWGKEWAQTLWQHFRQAGQVPNQVGKLSEVLLITKINDAPYYRRTTVTWDGDKFGMTISGQTLDKSKPYVTYSGSCREFVVHGDDKGGSLVPAKYRNWLEEARMHAIGKGITEAASVDELASAVRALEEELTQIDTRLEGDRATIAPPYAMARWNENGTGWVTDFNPGCNSNSSAPRSAPKPPKVDSSLVPSTKNKK